MMYDAGAYYHAHGWHIEAEYLLSIMRIMPLRTCMHLMRLLTMIFRYASVSLQNFATFAL